MRVHSTKGEHKAPKPKVSLTKVVFLTTQISAVVWVSISYIIALYATVKLGQVFPVVDLSQQAITTILGVGVMKTVENIFEHNDSAVFGKSNKKGGENYGGAEGPDYPGDPGDPGA